MLVVGAKGHAKEVLDILLFNGQDTNLIFFDNVSNDLPAMVFDTFPIVKSDIQVRELFKYSPTFALGLGGTQTRQKLFQKMEDLGGIVKSIIADSAKIAKYDVRLAEGLNIMHNVIISSSVSIGRGSLINSSSTIHHDAIIGEFCEISPNVEILGKCILENNVFVGASAVILPGIKVGRGAVIGAGAVVTKNVAENAIVVGVPAKNKI